jgi:hypothetical protein
VRILARVGQPNAFFNTLGPQLRRAEPPYILLSATSPEGLAFAGRDANQASAFTAALVTTLPTILKKLPNATFNEIFIRVREQTFAAAQARSFKRFAQQPELDGSRGDDRASLYFQAAVTAENKR